MDNFLRLEWWKQLPIIMIGVPLIFLFIYMTVRVIAKAVFTSYAEYKKDLINRIFPPSGTNPQNNPKKEGGQENVN